MQLKSPIVMEKQDSKPKNNCPVVESFLRVCNSLSTKSNPEAHLDVYLRTHSVDELKTLRSDSHLSEDQRRRVENIMKQKSVPTPGIMPTPD
jgi:hypothetical protein